MAAPSRRALACRYSSEEEGAGGAQAGIFNNDTIRLFRAFKSHELAAAGDEVPPNFAIIAGVTLVYSVYRALSVT
jgi:hypothetical protein